MVAGPPPPALAQTPCNKSIHGINPDQQASINAVDGASIQRTCSPEHVHSAEEVHVENLPPTFVPVAAYGRARKKTLVPAQAGEAAFFYEGSNVLGYAREAKFVSAGSRQNL
eukprot:SAG31_NODE_430_length_15792_cov_15.908558_11_plen_112_part_00